MNNIYYELAQTQLALDAAQKVIRRQRGKLFGKNLLLVGTIGLFWTACKMLDESEKSARLKRNAPMLPKQNSQRCSLKRTFAAMARRASRKKMSDTDLVERRKSVTND